MDASKTLSVICARAGSKGLQNKCIRHLNDKMVFEYAVEYSMALSPNVETVVSSDIETIIAYCRERNIKHIPRRPELCTDNCRIDDVLADAIHQFGDAMALCSLVYGNIPIRYPQLFHQCRQFLMSHPDYDAAITMQRVGKFHPDWMFDYSATALPKIKRSAHRRQLLPPLMIHDGHSLLFHIGDFLDRYHGRVDYEENALYAIFGSKIKPIVNDCVIVDIDNQQDLVVAGALLGTNGV